MSSLLDLLGDDFPPERFASNSTWVPEAPPCLDGIQEIELDCETTGLRHWAGDKPLGISIYYGDKAQYLPWGHAGGNLDEAVVKRWAERELRGKRITNLNIKFDIHMLHAWGIDLEAQGNEVSDVGHYAALLDDHRKKFSLDGIATDYLGAHKIQGIDKNRMRHYHAGDVAAYAEQDVRLVRQLRDVMWPKMTAEGLQKVRQLEDDVIYPVCEMERNGAPIDMELLEWMAKDCQAQINRLLVELARECGFQVNPGSPGDKRRLFEKFKIPVEYTEGESASFTDAILKRVESQHPILAKLRLATKLISLNNKYLKRGLKVVSADGILRYSLHQLRSVKDEHSEAGEKGTVSGRFSSSAVIKDVPGLDDEGANIQQRFKVTKQRVSFGYNEKDSSHDDEIYLLRRLHKPAPGMLWLSADAEQIEYRMFASYANNPVIIEAYRKNPKLKFHNAVHDMLRPYAPDLTYDHCKNVNFCRLYGGGLKKIAMMLGFITKAQFDMLVREKASNSHPLLESVREIDAVYARELPEVNEVLSKAMHLAETRGYVCDLIGRRMRFPSVDANGLPIDKQRRRLHKAFNGIAQGGAATVAKRKLVELHRERKNTGFVMRFPVHDEVDGDIPDQEHALKVHEILQAQSFPQLKVPILWGLKTGKNWAECV